MRFGNYVFDQTLAVTIIEKIAIAALILIVTWIVAKAAKWTFAKLVDTVEFLRRSTSTGESVDRKSVV